MIKADRLSNLLNPHQFELVWEYWLGPQLHYGFARPSEVQGIFEHINIESLGKRGEAVYCEIVASPLRAHALQFKPAPRVDEVIVELGDAHPDRGYTEIETTDQAKSWETRVAEIAPSRARELANQHAESLAGSTALAREAAVEYVRLIRAFSDEPVLEYLAVQMQSGRAPEKGLSGEFTGLMVSQDDLRDAFECATLAIRTFGSKVDPDHDGFQEADARKSTDFKLRIDLITDLLRNGG